MSSCIKQVATKNCLIALNKLHKTLVASVNEVNGQQILHHPYSIVCHLYITIEISNLHNATWQLKKVWNFFVLKLDSEPWSSILNGFRLWHMA